MQGGQTPRFAYTVGLTEANAPEIVLAGASSLTGRAVKNAVDFAADQTRNGLWPVGEAQEVPGVGCFRIASVSPSWAQKLFLGAFDYYARDDLAALQLVPEGSLRTVDVPDLSVAYDPEQQPVWQWLTEPWELPVGPDSIAVTNLAALRGELISEAARWEPTEWEMFAGAGPDVPPADTRVVPLATLVGFDPSLEPVTRLEVGEAIHREPPKPWEPWGRDKG